MNLEKMTKIIDKFRDILDFYGVDIKAKFYAYDATPFITIKKDDYSICIDHQDALDLAKWILDSCELLNKEVG